LVVPVVVIAQKHKKRFDFKSSTSGRINGIVRADQLPPLKVLATGIEETL
jgi:hypothetical protein